MIVCECLSTCDYHFLLDNIVYAVYYHVLLSASFHHQLSSFRPLKHILSYSHTLHNLLYTVFFIIIFFLFSFFLYSYTFYKTAGGRNLQPQANATLTPSHLPTLTPSPTTTHTHTTSTAPHTPQSASSSSYDSRNVRARLLSTFYKNYQKYRISIWSSTQAEPSIGMKQR